jgi:hypothetical protein
LYLGTITIRDLTWGSASNVRFLARF